MGWGWGWGIPTEKKKTLLEKSFTTHLIHETTERREFSNSLVELRRADNSDGFWQHHLVGAVCVEVNAGQEGRLCGVSLGNTVSGHQFQISTVPFTTTILIYTEKLVQDPKYTCVKLNLN